MSGYTSTIIARRVAQSSASRQPLTAPRIDFAGGRVAESSASRRPLTAPRIDFAGAALFALFSSAKGAGLDPALTFSQFEVWPSLRFS
jgi:hypothetical protein